MIQLGRERTSNTLSAAPVTVEISASITSTGVRGHPASTGQSLGDSSNNLFNVASNGLDTEASRPRPCSRYATSVY